VQAYGGYVARRRARQPQDSVGADEPLDPGPPARGSAITLRTYTHLMPEALETARQQVDDWLAAQLAKDSDAAQST